VPRYVLSGEERELRDENRLSRWFKDEETRKTYFRRIDWLIPELTEGSAEPPDKAVQSVLAVMVEADTSFRKHVRDRNPANPDWKLLFLIAAGMILEAHIKACEDGSWPANS